MTARMLAGWAISAALMTFAFVHPGFRRSPGQIAAGILVGALVNLRSVTAVLDQLRPKKLMLVCAGTFEDSAFADPSLPRIDVKAEVVEELGADTHVLFSVAAPRVEVTEVREAAGDEDTALATVEGSLFTARVDPATSAKPGAQLRLAVDPSRFHYFDPETGLRLERDRALAAVAT